MTTERLAILVHKCYAVAMICLTFSACGTDAARLRDAITSGDVDLARRLIARGASPTQLIDGVPPIFLAVGDNTAVSPRMIEVLLDAGADVNQVELRGGMSALHQACFWGLDDAVAILLGRGADPNARDKNGKTPLMYLPGRSTARSIRITEMMLAHGADPNAVDAKGRTLVEQMRAKHLLDEIELLKRHTSEDGAH